MQEKEQLSQKGPILRHEKADRRCGPHRHQKKPYFLRVAKEKSFTRFFSKNRGSSFRQAESWQRPGRGPQAAKSS
jgi:hypothetical protein